MYAKFVIAVKGDFILLRAFCKKAELLGWDTSDVWKLTPDHCLKVYWNAYGEKSAVSSIRATYIEKGEKVYELPLNWNQAIQTIDGNWTHAEAVIYL